MTRREIEAAHRRMVEQVTSDERLLGALPEDLSEPLVRWLVARLDSAAARVATVQAYDAEADVLRREARRLTDSAEREGDDAGAFRRRLDAASRRIKRRTAGGATEHGSTCAARPPVQRGSGE